MSVFSQIVTVFCNIFSLKFEKSNNKNFKPITACRSYYVLNRFHNIFTEWKME